MITCKSPVDVMRAAHGLGTALFDERANLCARKDFTLPQLFACLVPREHQRKSYRGAEALLADCSDLRAAAGLTKAPDHNTLWRALVHLVKSAALDGTHFESRHVSRHFERRQRRSAKSERRGRAKRPKKSGRSLGPAAVAGTGGGPGR